MKVEIVYTTKSKFVRPIAQEMARWIRTRAKSIEEYTPHDKVDLLVVTFDDTLLKDKELCTFISQLSRQQIKNIALVNAFYINDKRMQQVIKLCQQTDLPLMREQLTWKLNFKQLRQCDQHIIDGARIYIEDMVNIVRNYY